jgi:glycosyltransferase involved in cell wall biosynthesis
MSAKKSLYIVGTNGLPVRYGGWDKLLDNLTLSLSPDYKIVVYTSSYEALPNLTEYNGAQIKLIPLQANGLQSIFYDFISMLHAVFCKADYILVLGISGGIFFPFFKMFKSKVILNPDGAEWKRTKFGKLAKKFLHLSEMVSVKYADKIISDNKNIAKDLLAQYGVKSHVIEYGADHVLASPLKLDTKTVYGITQGNYAIKVCRIVPENNIEMILKVFAENEYKLLLIGNWNNSQFGVKTREKFTKYKHLSLLDPIYDQEKIDELRSNCRLYVHGHSVGGTNPSLVEAMYLGLPSLVFDVNYNRETTNDCAQYFSTENELCGALAKIWTDDTLLAFCGKRLKVVAEERYRWSAIVEKYRQVLED